MVPLDEGCDTNPITDWNTDIEAALATVREALNVGQVAVTQYPSGFRADYFHPALAALDTLASELKELEGYVYRNHNDYLEEVEKREAAEAEVTRRNKSIEGAMARVNELEKALRSIESMSGAGGAGEIPAMPIAAAARAALKK